LASRTAIGVAVIAAALALAGCGEEDPPRASGPAPTEPPSSAPPPTRAPAEPPAGMATTPTEPEAATSPEEQKGGAGDEEPIRVPATFTFTRKGVTPPVVAVPAFLTIELAGVSKDGKPHTLNFEGTVIEVPAGGRGSARIEGRKAGRYPLAVDGRPNAVTIVSGAEPGP
jgi:hypothetical protein